MDYTSRQLEALKLLKDWSIWMVTVQVAAIAFLGTTARTLISRDGFAFPFTISCYALSIMMAAWVLSGIPSIVTRLDEAKKGTTYLHYKLYNIDWMPDRLTLNVVAIAQHFFFFMGIVGLAYLVISYRGVV